MHEVNFSVNCNKDLTERERYCLMKGNVRDIVLLVRTNENESVVLSSDDINISVSELFNVAYNSCTN